MSSDTPRSTFAAEGGSAYIGYRRPGGVTVRRPSGDSERFSAGAAPALAEAVLSDRLGHPPPQQLVETFSREWVEARISGEFVWPVAAVDEWLAAQDADSASRTPAVRSRRALRRRLVTALPRPHGAAHPHQPLAAQGGH